MTYELAFFGILRDAMPGHEPYHETLDSATEEAKRVLAQVHDLAPHLAVIYGPGLNEARKHIVYSSEAQEA